MLLRLLARSETEEGIVFRNAAGRPWTGNAVRCCMRRLRKHFTTKGETEKIVAYHVRHTMGTQFTAAGVRDRVLADLMGHSSTRTTARYQHLQVEHLWEAMEQFEKKNRRR
jgi:site-specific recombinase XerD